MIDPISPGSSGPEEQLLDKQKVGGSNPPRGSTLYGIVRKGFKANIGAAQLGHAVTECLTKDDVPVPKDTSIVYLEATKAQLAAVVTLLSKDKVPHATVIETAQPLAGMLTAVGLITRDRDSLKSILGHLEKWDPK
jgi:hypothetical protein